eukprot:4472785-Pleurochrysis_carterae.AAC.2
MVIFCRGLWAFSVKRVFGSYRPNLITREEIRQLRTSLLIEIEIGKAYMILWPSSPRLQARHEAELGR